MADPFGLRTRGITNDAVIDAMARVPREAFVPDDSRTLALADFPLPIGHGQTISQPYVVAWMTQELDIHPGAKVLEVGTGSGYQTAILAELQADVWSIELIPELAARAKETLTALGYHNLHLRTGSGYAGWPEAAPFDRILLTAAPPELPQTLVDQLAEGGRLLAPVGTDWQVIVVVDKRNGQVRTRESIPVRFVPMK